MTDRGKNNPQAFRRDPSKGEQPLEEIPIHIKKRAQDKRTGRWGDKWARRRLGKRRLAFIKENPAEMTVGQMAEHLKMPPHEVHLIRAKLDGIRSAEEGYLPQPIANQVRCRSMVGSVLLRKVRSSRCVAIDRCGHRPPAETAVNDPG